MARLKKFSAYRRLERPYTRRSKYREKSFIRVNPNLLIVKFNMGNDKRKYGYAVKLVAKESLQIRHNALESARMVCNRNLEKNLGKKGYFFQVRPYPHHVLRENPLAAGAGADRMSTGMKHAFGKAIGVAARVIKGMTVLYINVNKRHVPLAIKSLKRAASKLPSSYYIEVEEIKDEPKPQEKKETKKTVEEDSSKAGQEKQSDIKDMPKDNTVSAN